MRPSRPDSKGLHTMTGIPGWVGGAIYGNAGAYGHSIHEFVESVRYIDCSEDGSAVREIGNAACEFHYRESVFKRHKDWIVLQTTLRLPQGIPPHCEPPRTGFSRSATKNIRPPCTAPAASSRT